MPSLMSEYGLYLIKLNPKKSLENEEELIILSVRIYLPLVCLRANGVFTIKIRLVK